MNKRIRAYKLPSDRPGPPMAPSKTRQRDRAKRDRARAAEKPQWSDLPDGVPPAIKRKTSRRGPFVLRYGRKQAEVDIGYVLQLRSQGLSWEDIGKRIGVRGYTVSRHVAEAGLDPLDYPIGEKKSRGQ